ncbi:MAG: hypothetical protein ACREQZ_04235 [Woeseiaceae bacterium]
MTLPADATATARGLELVTDGLRVTTRGLSSIGQPELALEVATPAELDAACDLLRHVAAGILSCGWKLEAGDELDDRHGRALRLLAGSEGTLELRAQAVLIRSDPEPARSAPSPANDRHRGARGPESRTKAGASQPAGAARPRGAKRPGRRTAPR